MSGLFNWLFGGGQQQQAPIYNIQMPSAAPPPPVAPPPVPTQPDARAEIAAEQLTAARARGGQATLLSGPQGDTSTATTAKKTLLGG